MSSEDLELIENRPSLASTADSDLSYDDSPNKSKGTYPLICLELFENYSSEVHEVYESLSNKLSNLLAELESEIEPVNVREYKSLASNSVSLSSIRRSGLFRRRTAV